MTDQEKAIAYYKAAAVQSGANVHPPFVPTRVRIPKTVRGDGLFWNTHIVPGEYDSKCNQYGAVRVKASDGEMLGVRLGEFEPIEWVANPAAV